MSILAGLRLIRLGYRVPMLAGAVHVTIMLLLLVAGWTSVHLGPVSLEGFWLWASIQPVGGGGVGTRQSRFQRCVA